MVEPISNTDRERTLRWAKVGTVVLVGLSAGLISIQGDASVEIILVSVVLGLLTGAALVWYLFPDVDAIAPGSSDRYRDR